MYMTNINEGTTFPERSTNIICSVYNIGIYIYIYIYIYIVSNNFLFLIEFNIKIMFYITFIDIFFFIDLCTH